MIRVMRQVIGVDKATNHAGYGNIGVSTAVRFLDKCAEDERNEHTYLDRAIQNNDSMQDGKKHFERVLTQDGKPIVRFYLAFIETYADGEVIRLDTDGCLVMWDSDTESEYNSGETLDEFGRENLAPEELARVE